MFAATDELSLQILCCASVSATDKYTRHSVSKWTSNNLTQLYTGTTADNQLSPWLKSYTGMAPSLKWPGSECFKLVAIEFFYIEVIIFFL